MQHLVSRLWNIFTAIPDVPTIECLHEAQISCVVTGSSNYRWVAYFFNATFFEEDENRESVEALEQERQQEEGLPCLDRDPVPADDCPAAPPIRAPRRYFLRVFKSQMGRVTYEWREVVSRLEGIVGEYVSSQAFSIIRDKFSSQLPAKASSIVQDLRILLLMSFHYYTWQY